MAVALTIESPKSNEMERLMVDACRNVQVGVDVGRSGVSALAVVIDRGHFVDGLHRRDTEVTLAAPGRSSAFIVVTADHRIRLLMNALHGCQQSQ